MVSAPFLCELVKAIWSENWNYICCENSESFEVKMFIKSVILDGFKSYGKRTEINGFDPEFTAITGLNGTGKSNVLDAICFVLGISNLGQVCVLLVFCVLLTP